MSQLSCIVVTYRREEGLADVLASIARQTRLPHRVVVVDNEGNDRVAAIVRSADLDGIELLTPGENLGPAGGTALAMEHLLDGASDDDWVTRCDDDHPPDFDDLFEILERFAIEQRASDPSVGAVGAVGSRYDWNTGRLVRVTDDELNEEGVDVDYVATNCFPAFSVRAIRATGTFDAELFYGSSEVEYGLRLRSHGFRLVACTALWRRLGRTSTATAGPRTRLVPYNWRRYYSLRNQVYLLRTTGHRRVALKVSLVRGLGKPVANLPRAPTLALTHLRWNTKAILDGWRGRLGRTVEPDDF